MVAPANRQSNRIYQFGGFRLDAGERLLLRDGANVRLPAKVFDTLLVLIENGGRLVDKNELMNRVWPDAVVEEATLAHAVSDLRKALGESANNQQYIETVPKHGYRFIAPVVECDGDLAAAAPFAPTPEAAPAQLAAPDRLSTVRRIWLPLMIVALVLASIGAWLIYQQSVRPRATADVPVGTLAVLPFKPISSENRDEYSELGMADALITKLGRINRLVIRPTSSVRRYAGLDQDPLAAGREQRVDAVLDASIQKAGDRIRVNARLLSVADGKTLWAGHFDENASDIFSVQDALTEQMAAALAPRLTGEEKERLTKHDTDDHEAYRLYQVGSFFLSKRTPDGLTRAAGYIQQAIDRDPNYALAYAGLADAYALFDLYGAGVRKDAFPKAKAAAEKALALDDTLAEAHTSLAYVRYYYDWDWPGAEAEFKRAIEINPNYATAHQWYAEYLFYMGRFEESIAEINRAHELDPLSLAINTELGSPFFYRRQYDRAMEYYRKALEMDPTFFLANYCLALCYGQQSMFNEAVNRLGGGEGISATAGYYLAVSGKTHQAEKMLDRLIAESKRDYFSPYLIAEVHAGLGHRDQAFEWLEKAYDERDERIPMLRVDPHLDGLRSDARFADLLRRVKLAP